ncbi:MAG: hypothetical protein ACRCTZ_00685 [Sarcina sp.]
MSDGEILARKSLMNGLLRYEGKSLFKESIAHGVLHLIADRIC